MIGTNKMKNKEKYMKKILILFVLLNVLSFSQVFNYYTTNIVQKDVNGKIVAESSNYVTVTFNYTDGHNGYLTLSAGAYFYLVDFRQLEYSKFMWYGYDNKNIRCNIVLDTTNEHNGIIYFSITYSDYVFYYRAVAL